MSNPRPPEDRQSYHITFTTYGSWLHGDSRGSWASNGSFVPPNPSVERGERRRCKHDAVRLTTPERRIVFDAIRAEADYRRCKIHALNVLDNHVHVLIAVPRETKSKVILSQIKSSATLALRKAGYFQDRPVWTSGGNVSIIDTDGYFWRVYNYVINKQKEQPFDKEGR
ncbi:MAG: transposase [Thermoguttaceae bacterium]|nr:transposase [Thermoguttaceae bacterium]